MKHRSSRRMSATQATSLDKDALRALPIFGRNTFFAAISTAGVIQTGDPQFVRYQDQSGSSQLSLGGGPRRGNGYLIEGVSITDLTNRPTIAPSMEAVEELKVQTKTYEADMGHAAGGVFNTTARSGSNSWHGSGLLVSKPGATTGTLYFAKKPVSNRRRVLQLGGVGRRADHQEQDVLLVQHRRLQAAQHAQQRVDAADGPRASRRLLADPNANGQPVVIFDPLTTRTVNGAIVRDPFPGNVIPADRINPVWAMLGPMPMPSSAFPQRPGHPRRRPAEPGDAEDRSAHVESLDDDRDVCASTRRSPARRSTDRSARCPVTRRQPALSHGRTSR